MSGTVTPTSYSARSASRSLLMAVPVIGWFAWFLVIPLAIVVVYSFLTKGPYGGVVYTFTLDNYIRVGDWVYVRIFLNSFQLAIATTAVCLLLGYPMAYVMATVAPRWRNALLVLVMLPFLTNFVIRAYAFKILLGMDGPISQLLFVLGIFSEPLPLTNNSFAVWLGMITNYLPFMVLPLYVTIDRFDFTLLEAGWDLGASKRVTVGKILLPLTMPGIKAGSLLVFMPALGEFIIPDMLGGARIMLMGNLITEQFLKSRDWPFGAALSLILMLTVAALIVFERFLVQLRHRRFG